jgi:hypothetical protein
MKRSRIVIITVFALLFGGFAFVMANAPYFSAMEHKAEFEAALGVKLPASAKFVCELNRGQHWFGEGVWYFDYVYNGEDGAEFTSALSDMSDIRESIAIETEIAAFVPHGVPEEDMPTFTEDMLWRKGSADGSNYYLLYCPDVRRIYLIEVVFYTGFGVVDLTPKPVS